jgi:hypothetical protein
MSDFCTNCGTKLINDAKFCSNCGKQIENSANSHQSTEQITKTIKTNNQELERISSTFPTNKTSNIWFQNQYNIRKKVLTIWNKYWIEDSTGNILGFTKQKLLKLKEDIRVYTDESMNNEIFRIKQEQIFDVWGSFAIIDSYTNSVLGYIKRGFFSEFGRDAWEIQDINHQPIGRIFEQSLSRALVRKYLPGGGFVPEKMTVELNGSPIAKIDQDFKIIGDIWRMNCIAVPHNFDRRVLISCMILMGNIERDRK